MVDDRLNLILGSRSRWNKQKVLTGGRNVLCFDESKKAKVCIVCKQPLAFSLYIQLCSMYTTCHKCPSRSWKLLPYIYSLSILSFEALPPAASALLTISSTASRLSADIAVITSVLLVASVNSFFVNVLKNGSVNSITKIFSPAIMQAAFSSVISGWNSKPRLLKK